MEQTWTFESKWGGRLGHEYQKSSQRFDNPEDAATAAANWLVVNAINESFVSVRLVKLDNF